MKNQERKSLLSVVWESEEPEHHFSRWNIVLKLVLFLIPTIILFLFIKMGFDYPIDLFKLTFQAGILTILARLFCLIDCFLNTHNGSCLKRVAHSFVSLAFTTDITVFFFYWIFLAYFDFKREIPKVDFVFNLLFHTIFPLVNFVSLALEKTEISWKEYRQMVLPYGLLYAGMLMVYAYCTGKGVYDPLFRFTDWVSFAAVGLAALMFVAVHWLSLKFSRWVQRRHNALKRAQGIPLHPDEYEAENEAELANA